VPSDDTATEAIEAIVFDLDGVLIDSEASWSAAREAVAADAGGRWHDRAQMDMMGMSSTEWSRYMHEELAVPLSPEQISERVVERLEQLFRDRLPLLSSAPSVVKELAQRWPLAIASSSNRPLIELVLELSGFASSFRVSISSEEVASGKPSPDVYLAAAERLGIDPRHCVAVEDSANGLRAANAAGMRLVAIPNRDFPPDADSLALAHTVLWSLRQLVPPVIDALGAAPPRARAEAARNDELGTGTAPEAEALALVLAGLSFGPLPGPGDSDGGPMG
jgi:HAD superfamily hydrolase (TIGR01509 family)